MSTLQNVRDKVEQMIKVYRIDGDNGTVVQALKGNQSFYIDTVAGDTSLSCEAHKALEIFNDVCPETVDYVDSPLFGNMDDAEIHLYVGT